QRLEIRQGQGLVITPQLQQAIKLLQLSNLELDAFVEAELERNPLLQRDESDDAPGREEPAPVEASSDADAGERELDLSAADPTPAESALDARDDDLYADASPAERAADRAGDAADAGQPLGDWSRAGSGGGAVDGEDALDRALRREKTLAEHLADQAALAGFTPAEHAIA